MHDSWQHCNNTHVAFAKVKASEGIILAILQAAPLQHVYIRWYI